MAKRTRGLRDSLPRLAPLAAAAAAMLVSPAGRADWRIQPTVGVSATWTDNVDLRPDEEARSNMVTEITPAFLLTMNSRRLKGSVSGSWRQYAYRDGDAVRERNDNQVGYGANVRGVLAENLLFVDMVASRQQRSISAFGPQASANPFSKLNRTYVETWSVSPYLVQDFGREARAMLRYTRDSVETDERNRFGNSTSDTVILNLDNEAGARALGWGLRYLNQHQDNELAGKSSVENLNANLRYSLSSAFALTASAGYDRYDYNAMGGRTAGRSWSTGFTWTPSQRTNIAASIGRHFYGATGSLAASVRSRRTVWNINYGDTITNSRSQYTLPSAIDTAALLDSLFLSTIPDPVQRQQAVNAYIEAAGLPPSLADDVNYLSNRYRRQKLLQASVAWRSLRSSAVASLYASKSTALSSQEADSALLGSQLASLNDNVRQSGASLTWSRVLSPRSNLVAAASYSRSESLTTAIQDRQRMLRVGINSKLGRQLAGSLELRRRSGGIGAITSRDYTEHALVAALSMQY